MLYFITAIVFSLEEILKKEFLAGTIKTTGNTYTTDSYEPDEYEEEFNEHISVAQVNFVFDLNCIPILYQSFINVNIK